MSDGQLLLSVLAAFTLYECLRWVPIRAWVFQPSGRMWRGSRPWETFRTRGGAVALLTPLPPMDPHVVTAAWPCAPHEVGLCVWQDESGAAWHVPWDKVDARVDGAALYLAPGHRVLCVNADSAASWAETVNAWARQSHEERRQGFLKRAATMLEVEPFTSAAEALRQRTRWLRWMGTAIFACCFCILPVLYWRYADTTPTLVGTGLLFVLMFTQAFLLARAARIKPRPRGSAWQHILMSTFFPPSSMRAADWVCATRSPEAHPLAALKAWAKPEELEKAAARMWREARWPIGEFPERPWHGPEVEALEAFFKTHDLKQEALEAAPHLPDPTLRWCPRCHISYQTTATECTDCGGMKLLSQGKLS